MTDLHKWHGKSRSSALLNVSGIQSRKLFVSPEDRDLQISDSGAVSWLHCLGDDCRFMYG